MPELSVTNDSFLFFSSTILLSMNLNGQILAFPLLLFLPPIISPTLPINTKRNLIHSHVKYIFFFPNLRLVKREGPGKKIRS